jgi:hypothetical protein
MKDKNTAIFYLVCVIVITLSLIFSIYNKNKEIELWKKFTGDAYENGYLDGALHALKDSINVELSVAQFKSKFLEAK